MHEWLESFQWVQLISDGRSDYRRNQRVESETRVLEHSDLNLGKGRGKKKKKPLKFIKLKRRARQKSSFGEKSRKWHKLKYMNRKSKKKK